MKSESESEGNVEGNGMCAGEGEPSCYVSFHGSLCSPVLSSLPAPLLLCWLISGVMGVMRMVKGVG